MAIADIKNGAKMQKLIKVLFFQAREPAGYWSCILSVK